MTLSRVIATIFGLGYFPLGSGTLASAAGLVIFLLLQHNIVLYLGTTVLFLALGFLTSGRVERTLNDKDPSCVVIDEVAGAMIAFYLLPVTTPVLITAFFLFRAFDMFKVFPANRFESKAGSFGIMMDDVIAGLYTNIIMHVALILKDILR